MIALLQRVKHANVNVDEKIIGQITRGILVFLAVEPGDTIAHTQRLVERVLGYRIFSDDADKMNLSVKDIEGELLIVSQFTLAADTAKGMRPSFTTAAPPALGEELYNYFVTSCKKNYQENKIATGQFGANMQVSLCNDGPVTIMLRTNS